MNISALLSDDRLIEIGITFISKVMGALVSFLFSLVISRMIGAEESGLFFSALTILFLLSIFCRLGLENFIIRVNSIAWERKRYHEFYGNLNQCFILTAAISASIIIFFTIWMVLSSSFNIESNSLFSRGILVPICFALVPFSFIWLISASLKSTGNSAKASFFETGLIPSISLFLIGLSFLLGLQLGAEFFLAIYSAGCFLACVISMEVLRGRVRYTNELIFYPWKKLFTTSNSLLFFSLSMYLLNWGGVLLLGMYNLPAEAGQLNAANRIMMFVNLVVISFSSILIPKISLMFSECRYHEVKIIMFKYTTYLALALFPFLVLVVFYAEPIINIFGLGFSEGAYFLEIIPIGQFLFVIAGLGSSVLIGAGEMKGIRNFSIVMSILYLVVLASLVPSYGGVGAAVGIALIYSFQGVGMLWLVVGVFRDKTSSDLVYSENSNDK